ncbi:heme ABC exporter ATP-binding protein CcmA [Hyphomonas sp.]|uniref:heme ABC exporter ATP-binding protein CcmA n=1 Tax=Hyphomonas sp. TaxID=87 RepID=UPI00391B6936
MAADTPAPLIEATGLAVMRGERLLYKGVSLALAPGEAIRLSGANGSGKTTLLRMLSGLTRPEAGTITRHVPHHWAGHREGLKPNETPATHLSLWARAWGSGADIPAILSEMGLTRAAGVPGRYLSAGQRRRTALARLKLVDRPVWLLDEPYTALDAEGRQLVDRLIAAHRAGGGAIIAAIHGEAGFPITSEITL